MILTLSRPAEAQVPFKGTLQGQGTDLFQGNPPLKSSSTATSPGRYSARTVHGDL